MPILARDESSHLPRAPPTSLRAVKSSSCVHVELYHSRVDRNSIVDHRVQAQLTDDQGNGGPVTRIAVAPNGRFVACYASGGRLKVFDATSLGNALLDFDTKSTAEPHRWCGRGWMPWCCTGGNLDCSLWDPSGTGFSTIMTGLCGSRKNRRSYCASESCEILQNVPAVTVKTFEMGSTRLVLLFSMQAFHNKGQGRRGYSLHRQFEPTGRQCATC